MFPDLTQKAKSGILKFLWQNDPYKAKWALLAKAYSIVRDDHVGETSLDSFLTLNSGFIGIIDPARYLDAMGWQLTVDGDGQYTMARVKVNTGTEAEVSTNYSVNDIVKRCYDTGYVSETPRSRKNKNGHSSSGPVLAFAAQPSLLVDANDSIYATADKFLVGDVSEKDSVIDFQPTVLTHSNLPASPVDANNLVSDMCCRFPEFLSIGNCLHLNMALSDELDRAFDVLCSDPVMRVPDFYDDFWPENTVLDAEPLHPLPVLDAADIDRWLNV